MKMGRDATDGHIVHHHDADEDLEAEMEALHESIYEEIGRIIRSVQYVEWNLSNEYGLHISEEMAPGEMIRSIKSNDILTQDAIDELEKILKRRNDLVYKYFKRNSFEEQLDLPFLENELRRLESFNRQVEEFNDRFVK
jgi:hypothetical protein